MIGCGDQWQWSYRELSIGLPSKKTEHDANLREDVKLIVADGEAVIDL
jgi:hypothetical protein